MPAGTDNQVARLSYRSVAYVIVGRPGQMAG